MRFRKWRLLVWERRAAAARAALKAYEYHAEGFTNLSLVREYTTAIKKRTLWKLRNGLGSGE